MDAFLIVCEYTKQPLYRMNSGIVKVMTVLIKVVLGIILVLIFFSLGSALYFLVRDTKDSDRIVKALTWRIGLSILLFVILCIAFAMGWIKPHPVG